MNYLAREDAPISEELWEQIDKVVIDNAKQHLVCRRFLDIYGPLGAGADVVSVDSAQKDEELDSNIGRINGRKLVELPQFYEDFHILWRDIARANESGHPLDLAAAARAAQRSAKREDNLILFGSKELGTEGLYNASDTYKIKKGNWAEGEDAYRDIAHGIAYLSSNSMLGRYALIVSPEIWLDLQRLQPNVGLLEIDRIKKLVDDRVYPAGTFGAGKAALVCAEPQYIDLAIGMDLSVGYLEQKDFNHYFRILETAALRIKEPKAIVQFE